MARTAAAGPTARVLPREFLLNPASLQSLVSPPSVEDVFPSIILAGAPGSGKSSLAWAWGCALNCPQRLPSGAACGVCRSCRRFLDGQHPDLNHLAVAEESQGVKVEQVRELQERLQYRPFEARWRLVVIDRADTMSEGAANCLLKTLEEPPSQSVFVLTTAHQPQLLPTIQSRCRLFKLLPVPQTHLISWLTAQGHAPERAALAARLTQGSPGHTLSRLADKPWWTMREEALRIFEALAGKKMATTSLSEVADTLAKTYGGGRIRLLEFMDIGASWFRDGLLLNQGARPQTVYNLDGVESLTSLSTSTRPQAWLAALDHLADARLQLAGYIGPKMVLTLLFRQILEGFSSQE